MGNSDSPSIHRPVGSRGGPEWASPGTQRGCAGPVFHSATLWRQWEPSVQLGLWGPWSPFRLPLEKDHILWAMKSPKVLRQFMAVEEVSRGKCSTSSEGGQCRNAQRIEKLQREPVSVSGWVLVTQVTVSWVTPAWCVQGGPGLQQQFGTETEMHFPAGANSPLPVSCAPQPAPSRAQELPCLTRPLSLTCLTGANCGLTSPLLCLHLAPLGTAVGTPSALKHPDWGPVVPKARTSPDLHWEGKPVSSQECQPGCLILLPMFVLQRPAPSPGEGWPA